MRGENNQRQKKEKRGERERCFCPGKNRVFAIKKKKKKDGPIISAPQNAEGASL